MNTEYLSAPLPFVGQKRMFAQKFKEVLKEYPDNSVFVDLFGGSGLLSHITKREKPNATVIYNDYDNYRMRLNNINRTNALLSDLRKLTIDCPRQKLIPEPIRGLILERLRQEETTGFVDYITISSSLLFSSLASSLDKDNYAHILTGILLYCINNFAPPMYKTIYSLRIYLDY